MCDRRHPAQAVFGGVYGRSDALRASRAFRLNPRIPLCEAEGVGFEPTSRLATANRFSRPAHSTALPPLRGVDRAPMLDRVERTGVRSALIGWSDAAVADPGFDDGLLRRHLLLGDRTAAARLRRRIRAQQGGSRVLTASYAAGTLLASLPAGLLASRFGPRRAVIAGLLMLRGRQRRLRLRRQHRPARRGSLRPGYGGGADLVRRADLADHRGARRAARLGDRHGPGCGGRRRPARPGPGSDRGPIGTEPVFGSVFLLTVVLARLRLPHCQRRARPKSRTCERSPRRSSPVRC